MFLWFLIKFWKYVRNCVLFLLIFFSWSNFLKSFSVIFFRIKSVWKSVLCKLIQQKSIWWICVSFCLTKNTNDAASMNLIFRFSFSFFLQNSILSCCDCYFCFWNDNLTSSIFSACNWCCEKVVLKWASLLFWNNKTDCENVVLKLAFLLFWNNKIEFNILLFKNNKIVSFLLASID